ncbi:conserved hypothetical protein [Talaromyces stipitatus ATCC 10500]|uniref:Uncharacterized protein n=1 Tax=Talaromyces stipitatus (strain ATCC 10500 / CBS 375.48 / QM 6759 / NRRL 1006) TaxID=441959 RepID=B8M3A0_TALSN|nr:uncharacterized protein TSTA_095180 [Talaromyces stipitatus ATCC 10500]EED22272.1 conserved hypothetical protein [Talaromyces stipitatus ATCC 10500]
MELRHGFRLLKASVSEIFDQAQLRIAGHNYMEVEDFDQIDHPAGFEKAPRFITRNFRSALIGSFLIAALLSGIFIPIYTIIRVKERGTAIERGGPFPPRQFEQITFHGLNGNNNVWNNVLPVGAGWVVIDDPEGYNLPPGLPLNGHYNKYGLSWAHQYHCLRRLRLEFWVLIENRSTLVSVQLDETDVIPEVHELKHLEHCHEYLFQAILCNMDMTIEYSTGDGISHGTIDGLGISHTCTKRFSAQMLSSNM